MLGVYSVVISLYLVAIRIAAIFNKKARLMVEGHKQTFTILRDRLVPGEKYLWFHAASLGEFEQGRPLMERIREKYPQYKILLTFFSPSGYEVRKNYEGADIICYLPIDTPINAKRFVKTVRPAMTFFIKYEFWQNYMKMLQKYEVPIYSVCSIFRPNQVFFRWYGGQYYKVLTRITQFFVQNERSKELLATLNIHNALVVGDTRFDRVKQISEQAKQLPIIEAFKQDSQVLVAGSSWEPDEDLIIPYFNDLKNWKLILAPHVVSDSHIKNIISKLNCKVVRYTEATAENVKDAKCLLIDCYGLLSSVYRYGDISYVGGGFGVVIHNLLEAAIYGIPVVFGPNNQRFQEAQDLKACGGGFEISDVDSFTKCMDRLIRNSEELKESGNAAGTYVNSRIGATELIMKAIFKE